MSTKTKAGQFLLGGKVTSKTLILFKTLAVVVTLVFMLSASTLSVRGMSSTQVSVPTFLPDADVSVAPDDFSSNFGSIGSILNPPDLFDTGNWANTLETTSVLVGAGDISSCGNNNDTATAKLLSSISGTVFTTGDNAYDSGTYTQYTNCYNPTWGQATSRTKPVPGNHDYKTSGAAGYFKYFGDIPSYYAYTRGAWRIYALNSEISVSSTSAQVTWLKNDLAAHPTLCSLAYWHKPRWSSGSTHGSDSAMQTLWSVLYNAKVDLVVNGHEHNYERFAPMNASGSAVSSGMREIVAGTGGESHYPFGSKLATSQIRNSSTYGVLKLTLNSSSYSWKFVPIAGSSFTDSGSTSCH